jgi:adenosine deaminase
MAILYFWKDVFAPKDTKLEIRNRIKKIEEGKKAYQDDYTKKTHRHMQLGLVCHFIKHEEDSHPAFCRHYRLRNKIMKQARALLLTFDASNALSLKGLYGVDVARNELYTPPEVFAPLYRFLRRNGIGNFTYHVGEDFVHLLSGIRAVYEAIIFLDLRSGNRIGHATAIGIDPALWKECIGETVVMRHGDYLDDLVFAHRRLVETSCFPSEVIKIEDDISKYSLIVYGKIFNPRTLWKAWTFRNIDPLLAFNGNRLSNMLDDRGKKAESHLLEALKTDVKAMELFSYYHGQSLKTLKDVLGDWNKLVSVNTEVLSLQALRYLQDVQLKELTDKNIAIESMLTSNLRIGFYKKYSEHHIFRWLGQYNDTDSQPSVCLASDDPGIFATNLRAEYFHLYRELIKRCGKSPSEAQSILHRLVENSVAYRFAEELNVGMH